MLSDLNCHNKIKRKEKTTIKDPQLPYIEFCTKKRKERINSYQSGQC